MFAYFSILVTLEHYVNLGNIMHSEFYSIAEYISPQTGVFALYKSLYPNSTAAEAKAAILDLATQDAVKGVPAGTPNMFIYSLVPRPSPVS